MRVLPKPLVMVVVCLTSSVAAADPNDKPVVLEFGTTQCRPCKMFDAQILTRREVMAALELVTIVHYDLDTPEGQGVAQRYNITAVPAFVVAAGPEGNELERVVGLPDPKAFVAMLARAPERSKLALDLLRAVEAHPTDMAARLRLAEFERASGRGVEAAVQYREIVNAPGVDPITLAHAHAGLEHLETAWALERGLDNDTIGLEHYPGSREATQQLARLAVAHRLAAPRLHVLALRHLAKIKDQRPEDLADALRAAILAGASHDDAERFRRLARAPKTHPALQLVAADLAMYAGNWVQARRAIEGVCRNTPEGYELACYARRATLAGAEHALLPGIGHLAIATASALKGTTPDPQVDFEALGDLDAAFGKALASSLLDASASCNPPVATIATLIVAPVTTGGRPKVTVVKDGTEAALANCLHDAVAGRELPPAPVTVASLTLPIDVVPHANEPAAVATVETPPVPLDADVVAFATFRTGAVETRGVGAQGLVDVTRLDKVRLVALGQAEVGTADRDASFVAHAMIGAGYVSSLFGVWSLSGGVGASQYGMLAPAALEFPIQVRVGFSIGAVRASVWGQSVVFPQEPKRQEHRLGGDEMSVGVSATIPETHLFVAGMVEDRVGGTSAVVVVGVPLANAF
jgi:thiol-disulfide isomerase/thioredoxin